MLQPGAETAREDAGAGSTGGAGASSDMAAIGDEDSRVREGGENEELGGSGANRWPRQETLALLKIRSDMDAVFRESSLKGPLWEEISRKMAEMGYRRSAKKCREKFENVYKYHKRTKDTRAAKGPDKSYRFFDQLEALVSSAQPSSSFLPPATAGSPPVESAVPIAMAMPPPRPPRQPPTAAATQPQAISTVTSVPFQLVMPANHHIPPAPVFQQAGTPSSSSSTSSDEVARTRGKRGWKGLLERLTKSLMEKQEELQRKFLEAMDKRDNDRRVREEAWKAQEIARLRREHGILVQERSMVAAKDAALISFLQKLSDHQQIPLPPALLQYSHQSQPAPPRPPLTPTGPAPLPVTQTPLNVTNPVAATTALLPENYNVGHHHAAAGSSSASGSRWPKTEVEALINLRTGMEPKYQEGGPKGPLWEDISAAMRRLGYDRSSKRCKEKWENINKYFKKVKDNDKKRRRDDSKTCPYYHQLEAIYSARAQHPPTAPILEQPEQQLPPPPPLQLDHGSGDSGHEDEGLYEEGDEEDDEDQAGG